MAPLHRALDLTARVDGDAVRAPGVIAGATACHIVVVFLDAATLWVLLIAIGAAAPPAAVFISFMSSSLFRTIGIVPGGLGTFEAASTLTLTLAGASVSAALSATLAFRVLSFWLPMLPGLFFSRAIRRAATPGGDAPAAWRTAPIEQLCASLGVSSLASGLGAREALARLSAAGPNELKARPTLTRAGAVGRQLKSPLVLLLVVACAASVATGAWGDAVVVFVILALSAAVGASREYRAQSAAAALLARVYPRATVLRDGQPVTLATREIVPGDVVLLSAGDLVPADGRVVDATDFFVDEAVLTGESFPVEKSPETSAPADRAAERAGCVFSGTTVRGGSARLLVVATGGATEFGAIARRLTLRPPETEFDRGVQRFGALLARAMLVMVVCVLAANMFLDRPVAETLLFAIALAVGLSPELLPAILSVNLARAAHTMAEHGVLVRHLSGIENLGSMDILCTDKTGTLTEGVVRLDGAFDVVGAPSAAVRELARINGALQTGLKNPLDAAILRDGAPPGDVEKLGEVPYDFVRKRLSVIVRRHGEVLLITKGAVASVLEQCGATASGALDDEARAAVLARFREWTSQGTRVLALATRRLPRRDGYGRDDERDLVLQGFLTFLDAPKPGVARAIADLKQLGVSIKLVTGDAALVARHVALAVGLSAGRTLTGRELDALHDEALWHAAEVTDLFVEVDPNQKERILLALKKKGHVVGFLGDGVNDAPAMHAADVGVSVDDAVDVARQAADFVLLQRDLDVIRRGIIEGRKTFANTLKYLLTTTSANLGNTVSMALASVFLPFLPLTAGQILLNNFLSDVPAIGIANDNVDGELVAAPRRWDMRMISRFMVQFGFLSSVFDVITFAALWYGFRADVAVFRSGWFVESLLTELVVALVVRTRRPFFRSRPGTFLLCSSVLLAVVAVALPFLPLSRLLGFVPLPPMAVVTIGVITALYVLATEVLKRDFYKPGTTALGAPLDVGGPVYADGEARAVGPRLLPAS